MRHFLIDHLRSKMAAKREGAGVSVPLQEGGEASVEIHPDRAVDLEKILGRLAKEDPRKARVVELRIFAEMEFSEIARELNVSIVTIKRDWQFCRAWLRSALEPGLAE
jgi:RNA polymerase sigma factor (TIGR02999 family)